MSDETYNSLLEEFKRKVEHLRNEVCEHKELSIRVGLSGNVVIECMRCKKLISPDVLPNDGAVLHVGDMEYRLMRKE